MRDEVTKGFRYVERQAASVRDLADSAIREMKAGATAAALFKLGQCRTALDRAIEALGKAREMERTLDAIGALPIDDNISLADLRAVEGNADLRAAVAIIDEMLRKINT